MKRLVREQRLGFVARVNADGTPTVSPKATFIVLADAAIGFANIRSPGTFRPVNSDAALSKPTEQGEILQAAAERAFESVQTAGPVSYVRRRYHRQCLRYGHPHEHAAIAAGPSPSVL